MKNLLLVLLFLGSSVMAPAQYKKKLPFMQEWYISAGGGVNYYLAEGYADYSVTDALGSVERVSVGYLINPFIGIRGNIEFASHTWPDKANKQVPVSFNSQSLTADLTINLKNWLRGYNKDSKFGLILFGGAGVGQRANFGANPAITTYILQGGLQADYRVSRNLSLNLATGSNVLADNFNNYIGVKLPFDLNPSVTFGVSYRIPTSSKVFYNEYTNYNLKPKRKKSPVNISFNY